MPSKTYNYKTIIGVTIDSRGAAKGTSEVEKQLTSTEKRALKMIETVKKALESLDKIGFNSAKFEAANARIIASDEKVLRAVRASEAQKIKLNEQTRREQIKTADSTARATERSAEAQIRASRNVAREEQRNFQSRAKFALDQQTREERYNQARFRSAQQYYRELERQSNSESRRAQQLERSQKQNSQKRIQQVSTVGGGIQSAGLTATAIATAPVVAGLYAAIKVGSEYEQSMNTLQAVTSATAEEMKRADDLAIKLGNDLSLPGVSAKDAAEAMTELGKAGFTVEQAMAAAKGTLQLSTAANISAAQAAEITANALNMFKLRAEEAGRVADLLAGAANASSAEITDVAASLQQAGSVFAAANVPIEDTITLIAELANQGIKGSDAGTSLKTMMQRLQSPTDNAADALKALNVSIYDQQGKMKPMREIIGQFEKSLGSLSEQQKAQALNTIFGSDAVRAANIVFSEGVAGFDKLSEAVQRANAAQDLAAARTKGLAGSWEALMSQAETLGLIIYNRIKEPLTELVIYIATFASAVTDAFLNLSEPVQKAILYFLGLVAAIGPVLTVMGAFIVALGSVASGLTALAGTATVGAAISLLAPIIAGVTIVIAGLTAGIAAAVAVVYGLGEAWEQGFGPIASIVAVGAAAILSGISPVLGIPILIGAMLVTLYEIWETNFGGLRDLAITIWQTIVDISSQALSEINRFVEEIGGEVVAWWRTNYPYIQQIVQTVNEAISNTVQSFLATVSGFWEAHGATVRAVVSYLWNAVKETIIYGVKVIGDVIAIGLEIINGNWETAWNGFLVTVRRITKFIVGAITEMNSLIAKAVIAIGKWLYENSAAIYKKIGEITVTGLKYLLTVIALLPVVLIKLVPKFISAGMQIGAAIWQGIKDGLSTSDGEENSTDLGINIDSLFDIPANPLENVTTGVEVLTKSMEKLGDITGKTTDKTTKFNKELGDVGGKSRKAKTDEIGNLSTVLDAMRTGTMNQESGGNTKARNGRTGATGLFQVMPANIPEWTRNTFGKAMSVEQFKDSPTAQVAVFNKYMGAYLEKAKSRSGGDTEKTIRMAAAAWYGGEGAMGKYDNAKRFRADEPSFREYTSSVYNKTKKGLNGKNFRDNPENDLSKISDEISKAEQDRQTMLSVEAFKTIREMPDEDLISRYNRILIEQAQKAGKLQPTIEQTAKQFEGFSTGANVSSEITAPTLDRRSQRFLETDDSLGITKRKKELDERRLYLADEILLKENDYILSLQEAQTDLQVEADLLKNRNLSFEAANEFSRQHNAQTRELGDIEIALGVLRQQNADDQFVQQRQLLASKREQISFEQEISDLQDKINNAGKNDALEIETARLRDIVDLRHRETAAIIAGNRAQSEMSQKMKISNNDIRAQVLGNLANQPSINDAIADGINKFFDKTADAIDKQFDKIGVGKIPVIGDILKAQARNVLSKFTSNLLDVFLPERGTGDPILDENKSQTKLLKSIDQKLGGVSALGNITGGASAGSSGGGGGILGFLKNLITGRRGASATPNFNPNAAGTGLFGGGGISAINSINGSSGSTIGTSFVNSAGQIVNVGGESGGTLGSIFGKLLGKGGIFGEKGFGNNAGTYGTIGAGAGLLGGFISNQFGGSAIGRRIGGFLSGAGAGLSIGASIGGPLGAAIGAGIGGLIGLFTSGGQRKKDEKARTQSINDALAQIEKLTAQVNSDPDFTDWKGVVDQGSAIKQSYLDSVSQLKDNKTRNIAIKDVSRIETKLRELEAIAKAKAGKTKSRAEALQLDVPTFADGGHVSDFIGKNYQNNPLGYVSGPGSSRSDSILARISNGEYILDARTVKNIGTANLDALRATQGKLKYMREPMANYADGGAVGSVDGMNVTSGGSGISVDVNCKTVIDIAAGTATTTSEVDVTTPYGSEKTVNTVVEDITRKGEGSEIYKALSRVRKNK